MSPDEHAAKAELWLENSHRHTDQGNEGDERIAAHSARQAIAHALLALRPAARPVLVDGPGSITVMDRDGDAIYLRSASPADAPSVAMLSVNTAAVLLGADEARRVADVLLRLAGPS